MFNIDRMILTVSCVFTYFKFLYLNLIKYPCYAIFINVKPVFVFLHQLWFSCENEQNFI